jgi:alanyl-tRNA synthetase
VRFPFAGEVSMTRALKTQEIREEYIRFFTDRGHRHVASSPLVPIDDPTLLFASAGMVQFKSMYAATGTLEYTRATSVQKCFRVTDLERVGHTPRHLTFFEMLGNFSFGDYFKREAIHWAWEFVIDVLHMDGEKLWASVYLDDDEAAAIWEKEVGLPAERIVRLGKKDNFWGPAGSSGACGPCSEIYMDLGAEFGCGGADCKPGCDCDRYQEFWNLVFPQFYQDENGVQSPLPRTGIDTGMGLERLAQLLQGKRSVFETDEFVPLRDAAMDLAPADADTQERRVALNVIAEHARAVTMLFNEGIYPSNEGRGYVARRILRRAARRGLVLGIRDPFLYKLTSVVVDLLRKQYPDLDRSRERIATVCREEETRFLQTLETGMRRFEEVVERTRGRGEKTISGKDAFTLYDTFGFPLDMTQEMAEELGLEVDEPGFKGEMELQVKRSQAAAKFDHAQGENVPWEWLADESAPHSEFVGYDRLATESKVVARRRRGAEWEFLLDVTPFYAEGGGQVGDRGRLTDSRGFLLEITAVRKADGLHVHRGTVAGGGDLGAGPYRAEVDAESRRATERNHTATHLLHAALKRNVGTHVTQAGSLVAPDRLRFDFHHFSSLTPAEIRAVEDDVNRAILADHAVQKTVTSMDEARQAGATAMFGEKYGDRVRQVFVAGEEGDLSRELCGGCHVRRTGEIGLFRIVSEESVAAGIRRVEAATGWNTMAHVRDEDDLVYRVAAAVKAGSLHDTEARVQGVVDENDRLRKEVARLRSEMLNKSSGDILDQAVDVAGVRFLAVEFPTDDAKALREAADQLRDRMKSGVGILAARAEEKVLLLAFVTDDLVASRGLRADVLVRETAKVLGGGGGGRPQLATAGGKDPERIPEALREGRAALDRMLAGAPSGG